MSFDVPKPVAEALRNLIRVVAFYNIRLDQIIAPPEAHFLRAAEERAERAEKLAEKQARRIESQSKRIDYLEKQLGIDEDL